MIGGIHRREGERDKEEIGREGENRRRDEGGGGGGE